jgi:hypothetical protein
LGTVEKKAAIGKKFPLVFVVVQGRPIETVASMAASSDDAEK